MFVIAIDDDPDEFDFIGEALRKIYPQVQFFGFHDVSEALLFLNDRDCPDYILIDVRMKKFDGLEVLSALRHVDKLRTATILMMSSSMRHQNQKTFTDNGAQGVFEKPESVAQYITVFSEVLDFPKRD